MELKHLPSLLLLSFNLTRYDPLDFFTTMRFFSSSSSILAGVASLLAVTPGQGQLQGQPQRHPLGARDLDSFVTQERAIAWQGVTNNIGPNGTKATGAGAGYVVASPSRLDPPCK